FGHIERRAPVLRITVIASEGGRFCSHHGIDWRELRERLEDADEISEARGVSSITQQTAKNLFLWSRRSLLRKALEFPLALWIDLVCRLLLEKKNMTRANCFCSARGIPARLPHLYHQE